MAINGERLSTELTVPELYTRPTDSDTAESGGLRGSRYPAGASNHVGPSGALSAFGFPAQANRTGCVRSFGACLMLGRAGGGQAVSGHDREHGAEIGRVAGG